MKPSVPPSNNLPGRPAAAQAGAADHSPATTSPPWVPNIPVAGGPAPGALEAQSAARGQAIIDAYRVKADPQSPNFTGTFNPYATPWPLDKSES